MTHSIDFIQTRAAALAVECPYCGAEPQQPCSDPSTGYELTKQAAHYKRIQAATRRDAQ